jgi:tripartite-type tricarboxylate transporter receptor subunit TctC
MPNSIDVARLMLGAVTVAAFSYSNANAQSRVDFAGKTVTVLSSFGSGGGYDIYGRLYAAHAGKHLPGNPTVVVRNMPGAGGMVGTNYLYNVAPKDGTMMGVVPQTVAIAHVLGASGVKYDVGKFNWIGRINSNAEVEQTWHTSAVKVIADAKTHQAVLAGTGPDSSSVVFPRILNDLFGMKFKVVPGYEGGNMATLAMERGEVDGIVRPWAVTKTVHPEWLRDKTINLLVQYSVERHHELPDVPAVADLAENESQRQILGLYASGSDIGRAIVAPPDLAAPTLAALRAAFQDTMKDPAFLKDIEDNKLDFDPLSGERLQEIVRRVEGVPPAVIETARKYSEVQK